ncbi:MAG: hypothetical protein ACK47B_12935 [Armatimonadota bacterium]
MLPGYRIASVVVLALLGVTLAASFFGWGLPSDASIRARSARQGGVGGRVFVGGGPGSGK